MTDKGLTVDVDNGARIVWVKSGKMPIASYSFEAWGGASKAQQAAHQFVENSAETLETVQAERDALAARLAEAEAQCEAEAIAASYYRDERDDARAAALRKAAALGREMTKAGATPGKIWRALDAMSEQAQPQPADQKRHQDTGPE